MPLTALNNSDMTKDEVRRVQTILDEMGFQPGPIDGIMGNRTQAAIIAFKRAHGLKPRPWIGPKTWELLSQKKLFQIQDDLPWMMEARKALNRHEVYDNQWLSKWLKSDGHFLGDPSELPWCGDFVETAIRLSLPSEKVPLNPYWALNWREFGISCAPTYGAIASIKRKGGGHVGFITGQDRDRYFMMGGNQSNKSSIVPVDKGRFEAASFRWPRTFAERPPKLAWIDSNQSSNTREA